MRRMTACAGWAVRAADGKIVLEPISPRVKRTCCQIESDEA
jgi:hypothetical protein